MSIIYAGTILYPTFIQVLINNFGWRDSYFVLGIMIGSSLLISSFLMRDDPSVMGL